MQEMEIRYINRRWEQMRLSDVRQEKALLSSILEEGIRDPLQGIECGETLLLLDGFKRLRCCEKLGLTMVPVISLGEDEAAGMLAFLRQSNARALSLLEQSALVDELHERYQLSVGEIARKLERSPAWVSVRLGMLSGMSEYAREEVFAGRFPARAYLYTLRSFTRVNKIPKADMDEFVKAVSGQELSLRSLDTLARGYFRGGPALKTQIREGKLAWTLEQLQKRQDYSPLRGSEKPALHELARMQKSMQKLRWKFEALEHCSPAFYSQAEPLVKGILQALPGFQKSLEGFYDTRG